MKKATVFTVVTVVLLLEHCAQAGVSVIMNGSFENDGIISDINTKAPQRWCDVNLPAGQFGGYVDIDWLTYGGHSLTLYSDALGTFDVNDMATVSQQVYLADVNQIFFDLKLSTDWLDIPWNSTRSAVLLIDGNIIWDSKTALGSNATGEYINLTADVNQIYKDPNSHLLSLGIRVNIVEDIPPYIYYFAQWDVVRFDAHCEGFGYLQEDLNRDCYVDMLDFGILAGQWLEDDKYDLFQDSQLIVNLRDLAIFATYWQDSPCRHSGWCSGVDLDRSGVVDFVDLMIFADYWLQEVKQLPDLNTDRVVDFEDFAVLADSWMDSTFWQGDELPAADLNDDGIINLHDFAIVSNDWLGEGTCIRGDINGSGFVDYGDMSKMAEQWLQKSWLYDL